MSLEDVIKGNTEAIMLLTETLIKHFEANIKVDLNSHNEKLEQPPLVEPPPPSKKITYTDMRTLLVALANRYREDIKKLNEKYGLATTKDMLVDPDNSDGGVKDQNVLESYYSDLLYLDSMTKEKK